MFKKLELKKHAMTGISYMLPLVVASGLLIAIGNLAGGNPAVITDYKSSYSIWQAAVSLGVGLIMFFVIGGPIALASAGLTDMLNNMQGGSKAVFGASMGAMAAFDFGGPVNKVASLFADGLLLQKIYGPEAIKICASMIPPFGVTLSWLIRKKRYTKRESDNIKIAFPMGICMITEGVIPIAAVDPLRVIFSCSVGSAVGGMLIMLFNVGSPVPSGGMFIVPAMQNPVGFLIALGVGSVITAVLLVLLKKDATEEEIDFEEEEEEIDLSDIKIK